MSDFHSDYERQLLLSVDALFGAPQAAGASQVWRDRRLPLLAAIAIGMLLLAAAAFAADRIIGVGTPVRPTHGPERSTRSTGIGIAVPAGKHRPSKASLLSISFPDPAGGLPWGMRVVTTTRGLLCVQVGRLLGGRLGVLGQEGRFHDDGLFHELPPSAVDQSTCTQPEDIALYNGPGLAFGLLGPQARSVYYRASNRLYKMATSGSDGAYLIVLPRPPSVTATGGGQLRARVLTSTESLSAALAGHLLSTVIFDVGGRRCQTGPERQTDGPPICAEPVGAGAHVVPLVSGKAHLHLSLTVEKTATGYELRLAFTAPVTVSNASTAYGAEYALHGPRACEGGGEGMPIERDVKRGQRVHVTMSAPRKPGCRGVVRGRIFLGRQTSPLTGPSYDERTVGRFSFWVGPK
ncbi:MAG TPA: hypothetical protein VGP18_03670 [Solirubrobacteraceae bacterium]|jgi:hypothetical protein|nr:hypothetical protein [Solirubrobacteraceae bacterium]